MTRLEEILGLRFKEDPYSSAKRILVSPTSAWHKKVVSVEECRQLVEEGILDPERYNCASVPQYTFIEFIEKWGGGLTGIFGLNYCNITGIIFEGEVSMEMMTEFSNTFHHAHEFNTNKDGLYCWYD